MDPHDTPDQPSTSPAPPHTPPVPAQDALARLAGTRLADFFLHIPATVWMTDERMAVTFVQGKLIRTLNVDPQTIIGRTLPNLLLDGHEDHPLVQGHLTALAGHETSVRIEWGGNIYHARIAPLRDAAGAVVGCVGIQQQIGWLPDDDITVRESDVLLQRVIDWNIVGIAFGDVEGHITDANDAFLEISGHERDDLIVDALSWPALMPVEHHHRQVEALEEILATGRCTPFETQIIRPDGRRVDVVVSAARLSAKRREGIAFVLDVSKSKRVERSLRTELACADALAEATRLDEAAAVIAGALCDGSDWMGAVVAARDRKGGLHEVARHGDVPAGDLVPALLQEADASRCVLWATEARALVVPAPADGVRRAAVVLFASSSERPGPDAVAAVRAVADRLARFLERQEAARASGPDSATS